MVTRNISPRPREEAPDKRWMSLIFGPQATLRRELEEGDEQKIEIFEAGLSKEINAADTIETAFTKIVRMALACEFGGSFVRSKGAKGMIDTIVRGIMGDSELRRQALLIIDRYAR